MENIRNVFYNARNWECNVEKILTLAEKAEVHSSFFGARYVRVVGYDGTIHINAFAERLHEIVEHQSTFTVPERQSATKLYNRIVILYDEMREDLRCRNVFTRFLANIREALNIFLYEPGCGWGVHYGYTENEPVFTKFEKKLIYLQKDLDQAEFQKRLNDEFGSNNSLVEEIRFRMNCLLKVFKVKFQPEPESQVEVEDYLYDQPIFQPKPGSNIVAVGRPLSDLAILARAKKGLYAEAAGYSKG